MPLLITYVLAATAVADRDPVPDDIVFPVDTKTAPKRMGHGGRSHVRNVRTGDLAVRIICTTLSPIHW